MLAELKHAARRLRADRWTSATAILTAALGAGLNTAVFAVAYGILVRPLPYASAGRLVIVDAGAHFTDIDAWRTRMPSFERMSAFSRERLTVFGGADPQLVDVAHVDEAFFATLGTPPREGRAFGPERTQAVVSERFAHRLGGGTPIGRTLTAGGASVTITAVMPQAFAFPTEQIDIWIPAALAQPMKLGGNADMRSFRIVGRLKAGVSIAQARSEAVRAAAEIDQPRGRDRALRDVRVTPLEELIVAPVKPVLLTFSVAAAIVLLIACANIGTILIGRTLARQRELAVCRALGASPARMAASVLSESLLIATAGAAAGVLLAEIAVRELGRWAADLVPRLGEVRIDWTVLFFAAASTAVATMAAAAPALRALRIGTIALRASGAVSRSFDRRIRGGLVIVQIALAVVLLAGGALLVRTVLVLLRSDVGVSTRGTTIVPLRLTEVMSFNAGDRAPILGAILQRVRELPGVTAAGAGNTVPPDTGALEVSIRLDDQRGERLFRMSASSATPGYLPALGARLLEGRDFTDADAHASRPAVILSQGARALMPPGDVVGRELPLALPGPLQERGHPVVIGVVGDIKYTGLEAQAGPAIYVMWNELPAGQTFLALRSTLDTAALAPSLRAIVRDADPRMPAMPARTLDDMIQKTVADQRLRALLGGAVALLAVSVAMVGLAGMLMRMVLERRHELAIRAALGATSRHTIGAILRDGVVLATIGIGLGLAGALAAGRALRAFVHGAGPYDPGTLAAVAGLVWMTSIAVCYVPARRASRIDPLALLRTE